jgi:hypothetical protein
MGRNAQMRVTAALSVRSFRAVLGMSSFVAACSGTAAVEPRAAGPGAFTAAPASTTPRALPFPDAEWRRVTLDTLALSLELPDAHAWQSAGGMDWVRLIHRGGESSLELRRLRAEPTVRPADCASRAGFSWETATDGIVERRTFDGRDGLRGELVASIEAPTADGALAGRLEAVSVGFRVCLAVRLRTHARGEGREAELARRLLLFGERVVPSLSLHGIEDRVTGPDEPGLP